MVEGRPHEYAYEMPEETDEETFRAYMESLDLHPEDFDKKILDVGSGSAKFARWAKDHRVSNTIYSLEPFKELTEKSKSVMAKADAIPFKDNTFDLVISVGAIPQIFVGYEYDANRKDQIKRSLSEMLRVGKEVRIGDFWPYESLNEHQRKLLDAFSEALEELRQEQSIEVEDRPGLRVHLNDDQGKTILAARRLFIIKKSVV